MLIFAQKKRFLFLSLSFLLFCGASFLNAQDVVALYDRAGTYTCTFTDDEDLKDFFLAVWEAYFSYTKPPSYLRYGYTDYKGYFIANTFKNGKKPWGIAVNASWSQLTGMEVSAYFKKHLPMQIYDKKMITVACHEIVHIIDRLENPASTKVDSHDTPVWKRERSRLLRWYGIDIMHYGL